VGHASDPLAVGVLRVGEVHRALTLAVVTNVDERTTVQLGPAGTGPVLKTAPDGSRVLVVAQGLAEKLRALEAATVARSCALCGCTDDVACPGGCHWATPELCSMCVPIALVPT
jgi:hypothetical protein